MVRAYFINKAFSDRVKRWDFIASATRGFNVIKPVVCLCSVYLKRESGKGGGVEVC
jgi:hypothetical protein